MRLVLLAPVFAAIVAGCAPSIPAVPRFVEATPRFHDRKPDDPDACFARMRPYTGDAADFDLIEDDSSTGGSELWVETPCEEDWTPDFTASLQRALIARKLMPAPATGTLGPLTRTAIRAFQRPLGLDSDVLSVAAAKRLGLVVYDRDELIGKQTL